MKEIIISIIRIVLLAKPIIRGFLGISPSWRGYTKPLLYLFLFAITAVKRTMFNLPRLERETRVCS